MKRKVHSTRKARAAGRARSKASTSRVAGSRVGRSRKKPKRKLRSKPQRQARAEELLGFWGSFGNFR